MVDPSSNHRHEPQDVGRFQIPAHPTTYRGQRYRSTLEADWAATFDALGLGWERRYESIAVTVAGMGYLPDFLLYYQRVWVEVKGPDNIAVEKPHALALEFGADQGAGGGEDDPYNLQRPLVVIGEPPGPGETMCWRAAHHDQYLVITHCAQCDMSSFMDYNGIWACRYGCRNGGENKFWRLGGAAMWHSGELAFGRAPGARRGHT